MDSFLPFLLSTRALHPHLAGRRFRSDRLPRLDRWETVGFVVFAFSLMNFFGITRSFISANFALVFVATGLIAGLATLGRFLWVWWHQLRPAQS